MILLRNNILQLIQINTVVCLLNLDSSIQFNSSQFLFYLLSIGHQIAIAAAAEDDDVSEYHGAQSSNNKLKHLIYDD
jgi:hypothetical protein